MLFESLQLPGKLVAAAVVVYGAAWVTGQTVIGPRLIEKSGVIAICEGDVATGRLQGRDEALAALGSEPQSNSVPADIGRRIAGAVLGGYPGGKEYIEEHGPRIDAIFRPWIELAQQTPQAEAARRGKAEYDEKRQQILTRFQPDPKASTSICGCRARAAVIEQSRDLGMTIATLWLVPAPDWSTAIRTAGVVERCGGRS